MKNMISNIAGVLGGVMLLATFHSCSDVLDTENLGTLSPEQHYRDIYDANSAVLGIYGQVAELGPKFVVLNELRADLMSVTGNSDHYLREIAENQVSAGNPWADPQPFYAVINNCNDAMKNLGEMYSTFKLNREDYYARYSDLGAIRSWIYLQLAIHYGNVPYITEPIENLTDVNLLEQEGLPYLDLETMIDSLVLFTESLPFKGNYIDENLQASNDGSNSRYSFIDKDYLLGTLHLWDDNYVMAASYFKSIMERGGNSNYHRYRIPDDLYRLTNFHSGYVRYSEDDINSRVNNWGTMFSTYGSSDFSNEWIWVMYYSSNSTPSPFIDYFSNTNGNYVFKPSKAAIQNWESQVQQNGFKGDFRGDIEDINGNSGSFKMVNGQPVITKYINEYDLTNPFEKNGKWYLWRAAGLHLNYCEAANRDGQYKVAYSLLNNGIAANYPGKYPEDVNNFTDTTGRHQTLLPFPYDFDARSTSLTQVPPGLRQPWIRSTGLRNRVYLENIPDAPAGTDSMLYLEDKIIEESALELAYEGYRWGDLVRIAKRRNDPSFLADKIYQKLLKEGNPDADAVRQRLMDEKNWCLPLNPSEEDNTVEE